MPPIQCHSLLTLAAPYIQPDRSAGTCIIGVCGSVAVGKSTTARFIKRMLSRWNPQLQIDIVASDGFLYPNAVLEARGLMHRKGYPESYDVGAMIQCLADIKAGISPIQAPVYSHTLYDISSSPQLISRPDIVIIEGLNILQLRGYTPEVSDFIDCSIYVDAPTAIIEQWYIRRFMSFRRKAYEDPHCFYHRFCAMEDEEAEAYAKHVWKTINEPNLINHILPTKMSADVIWVKNENHRVKEIIVQTPRP